MTRCWVMVFVLLAPLLAQAESPFIVFIAQEWPVGAPLNPNRAPTDLVRYNHGTVLAVLSPHTELQDVHGIIRLYLKPDVPREQLYKVRCEIAVDQYRLDMADHLIRGNHGPELTLGYLPRMVPFKLAIFGDALPPYLHAVTFDVISDQGQRGGTLEAERPVGRDRIELFHGYQEVHLNDVCE